MNKRWLIENNFIWHSDPSRLKKFIHQYEIFKMTKNRCFLHVFHS